MSEFTNSTEPHFYSRKSNEDVLFAGTLRDWCDPLLQGQAPQTIPLCPRCAGCKCESIKDLQYSTSNQFHEPSCPSFGHRHRHHSHQPRSKTAMSRRSVTKGKRRANSLDPACSSNHLSAGVKRDLENASSSSSIATEINLRQSSSSRIPVRISARPSSTGNTPASEYSSTSSTPDKRTSAPRTRIPRPIIVNPSALPTLIDKSSVSIKSNTDDDVEDYDLDR